ncbi:DinB family protein [Mycobacterium servetii]|uniref:DinB family protein n=1 Tax=Mycobacterium servetii TaxID=3237418 RepID=UPI00350FA52D
MDGQNFAASAGPIADEYVNLLESTNETMLRARPSMHVWSPLEYACHVRDLLLAQRERVLAARRQDRPVAEPMGRDERVEHDGYNDQSPSDAKLLLSNAFGRLSPADWDRTVIYPYAYPDPNPAERSLRWMATHTLHELPHHLIHVRRQLDRADAARVEH